MRKTIGLLVGTAVASALASALLTPDGKTTRGRIGKYFSGLVAKLPANVKKYLGVADGAAATGTTATAGAGLGERVGERVGARAY